jgi:esterase/lipase superfamily enzyme
MIRAPLDFTALAFAAVCAASCHSAPPPPTPPPAPAPLPRSDTPRSYAVLDSGAARITIFVATTRRYAQSDRAGDRFGPDDADSLQYAAVTVNVPPYSTRGTGELPRQGSFSSAFSSAPNPAKEFFVASVIPADSSRFVQRIAADLALTRSRNILVFIHGFNTSFEDAAVRAAQIAADLNFDGSVVLFSWPSAASVTSYVRDQQAARNAGFHLLRLLRGTLVAARPDHLELLVHSMGSEALAKALILAPATDSLPRFDQVVFAAPDLDRRVFAREILPKLDARATRVTLYASNDDDALRASRAVNGVWRLGLGGDSLLVIKGMDTIDASRVRADAFGHTLFGNQAFLADLSSLLAEGKSPAERRLLAVKRGALVFYRFRGDPR